MARRGYQREETAARAAFEAELGRHAAAEAERRHKLAERRATYDQAASAAVRAAQDHNAGVDAFERDFLEREPEAAAEFCTLVLDSSVYPEGFAHRTRALYRPDPREVAVEYELPPQSVIPAKRDYKYVATRDEIDTPDPAGKRDQGPVRPADRPGGDPDDPRDPDLRPAGSRVGRDLLWPRVHDRHGHGAAHQALPDQRPR